MKTLYLKESKKLDNIQTVKLVDTIGERTQEKIKNNQYDCEIDRETGKLVKDPVAEDYVEFKGTKYEIIKTEQLKEKTNEDVYGYIEISDKVNQKSKVKLEDVRASVGKVVAVQSKKKAGKIIGYVEARDNEGKTIYIGLYKANLDIKPILIAIAAIIAVVFIGSLFMNDLPVRDFIDRGEFETEFKDGDKGTGELGTDEFDFGDQPVFRIKLNCTPTVIDDKMNIRIESPEKENKNYGFVVKVYALQKIDEAGNIIETYEDNSKMIYESPIVYANENIEECILDNTLEDGTYIGRAVYEIYDLDKNFIGQTAARLEITVVSTVE